MSPTLNKEPADSPPGAAIEVLCFEDNPTDSFLVRENLREASAGEINVTSAESLKEGLMHLQAGAYDVILLDPGLPDSQGMETFAMVYKHARGIPIVVLTGLADEGVAVEALRRGSQDYLVKGQIGEYVLVRSIRYAIERRHVQDQLRRAHAENQLLLDSIPSFLIGVDRERRIFQWNHVAEAMFGLRAADVMGLGLSECAVPWDWKRFDELVGTPLQGMSSANMAEIPFTPPGGKNGVCSVTVTAIMNERAEQSGFLLVGDDITEKKSIESQLFRTQRMESIGTLAGGIAHDLNNVLAPIVMGLELLRDRSTDDSSRVLIETMATSAKRGAGIVRQVLTFARGTEGEQTVIPLKDLLENTEKMLLQTFPKFINIRMAAFLKDLWVVRGDATQLDQVLLNLCMNARDAMPHGGTLTLSAKNMMLDENHRRLNPRAKAGPYILMEVADTGTGIPPETVEKIFDPFFTTKEVGKGTGLGLSTVQAIVKSHGGFVNVYSEIGEGTSFKVFLPAKQSAETAAAAVRQNELPRGKGELILIVDDEAAMRDIAQAVLETYNYRVITAKDGAEALRCYARQKEEIKAVLLDMMMPIMDGPATIGALEAMNPGIKIIAASGLMDDAKHDSVSGNGSTTVRALLTKPYSARKLLETLSGVIHDG